MNKPTKKKPKDQAKEKFHKTKNTQDPAKDKKFTEAVKIMANTPPVTNKELKRRKE